MTSTKTAGQTPVVAVCRIRKIRIPFTSELISGEADEQPRTHCGLKPSVLTGSCQMSTDLQELHCLSCGRCVGVPGTHRICLVVSRNLLLRKQSSILDNVNRHGSLHHLTLVFQTEAISFCPWHYGGPRDRKSGQRFIFPPWRDTGIELTCCVFGVVLRPGIRMTAQ